ncbi:MAG: hypothetical protein IKU04_05710 [Bacteroidales bacterium]|nr:hypothetical protein [Bacteroidales bacterium]
MDKTSQETLSKCFNSLKVIHETIIKMMNNLEQDYDKLPESEQEGETGEQLGFEVDALDNVDYLLDEVITFMEENLGDRLVH